MTHHAQERLHERVGAKPEIVPHRLALLGTVAPLVDVHPEVLIRRLRLRLRGVFGGVGYWAYNQYDLGQYVPMEVKQCVNGAWDKINELMGRRTAAPAGYFEPLGDFDADEL